MIARLGEEDAIILHLIDQAVFLSDSPRPDTGSQVAQWFGFADAMEWIAANGIYQFQNTQGGFPIRSDPAPQILEKIAVENQTPRLRFHAIPVLAAKASKVSCLPFP